ncbi:MAG: SoxR reducing system RseC family protein [Bacteroidota bacterium]
MASRDIKHEGRISAISAGEITVTILAKSACTSCEAKGMCGSSEMKDKEIFIKYSGAESWKIGEIVNVAMKPSMGRKAVFLGYVFPLMFLIITMAITANLTDNEGIIGLSTLGSVGIYFTLLWTFRDKLNNSFTFSIEKYSNYESVCNV